MAASSNAQLLWRINNEYRRRLSQAQTYLGLLERLLTPIPQYGECLDTVRYTQTEIATLDDSHRDWRYAHLYENFQTKRVVQSEEAILHALETFGRMFEANKPRLAQLNRLLQSTDAPAPHVTGVPSGNLWAFMLKAVDSLARFDEYIVE